MQLREHYFGLAATEELDRIEKGINKSNDINRSMVPYPILPGGMLVRGSDGKAELIPHNQVEAFMASLPAAKKLRDKLKNKQSRKSGPQKSEEEK